MVICCWSAKGGSGCSTVAAGLARGADDMLLVDFAGDLPALAGMALETDGLADWLAAGEDVPVDALRQLEHEVSPGLRLIGSGNADEGRIGAGRGEVLAAVLASSARRVVVDCGTVVLGDDALGTAARAVCGGADQSLLVTRSCYLSLRRAQRAPVRSTGVVLIVEPGRALRKADVESALGVPVVASVAYDPAIARSVDAGLVMRRPPRSLRRPLARL